MAEFVFRLPDLAEGLEDAEVVAWRVAEGDRVELNQLIGELQTAKATVEIPSPCAGRVLRVHASPGDLVRVGEPLVTLEVGPSEGPGVVGRVPPERARGRRVRLRPPVSGGTAGPIAPSARGSQSVGARVSGPAGSLRPGPRTGRTAGAGRR